MKQWKYINTRFYLCWPNRHRSREIVFRVKEDVLGDQNIVLTSFLILPPPFFLSSLFWFGFVVIVLFYYWSPWLYSPVYSLATSNHLLSFDAMVKLEKLYKDSGKTEPPEFYFCRTMINGHLKCKDQVLGEQGQMLYMTPDVTVISQTH